MNHIISFKEIFSLLNDISEFSNPNFFLEQYSTPISILRHYYDFFPTTDNEVILDLGIGTGKLSYLASLLGSKRIIGVDVDIKALKIAKKIKLNNLTLINSSIEFLPMSKFKIKTKGVIMNPPFGTKRKFIDLVFLKKAMETNGWIITLHKNNKESFNKIDNLCKANSYIISKKTNLILNLQKSYSFHIKNNHTVNVSLLLLFPEF